MDNNNAPNVDHNDDSSSVTPDPIIEAGPTAVMDSGRQPPMTPEAQQELVDMLMTVEDNDDMPSLYEASFTESDVENVVDSNLGARAQDIPVPVDQQNNDVLSASSSQSSAFSTSPPPLLSTPNSPPHPRRSSNRRARVDDDGDEDRDSRHPSQRVRDSNSQPSSSNAPRNPFFGPYFTSFSDTLGYGLGPGFFNHTQTPNPSQNSRTPNMNPNDSNTNPTPGATTSSHSQRRPPAQNASDATNQRAPMQFVDYEFSIVMDGSRRPRAAQRAQHQAPLNDLNVQGEPGGTTGPTATGAGGPRPDIPFNGPTPLGNLATLLGIPFTLPGGVFGFSPLPEEKEDPERAKKLVDGLEEVPVGLVRRLERVGTGGGGIGEDVSNGGDVGCAVCWDRLLPEDVEQERAEELTRNWGGSESMIVDGGADESRKEGEVELKYPKVVSLPCAHVFHAECLMPWFSQPRHTTCPTCRFNIDPDNLTYVSPRQRRREQRRAANNDNNDNVSQPPEGTQEDRPADPASPDVAATMDTDEQPSQPQERQGEAVVDFGGRFDDMFQMLNAQGQLRPDTGAPDNGGPGAQPQARGPYAPLMMSIPMPVGAAGVFPVGFGAGQPQMPMPMPVPFMAVPLQPGNAEADPMPVPMPWRMMADSLRVAAGGGNQVTAANADSGGAPGVGGANPTPATTAAQASPSNNAPQAQTLHHHPTIVADVVRISVDMVFDGRPRRRADQGPANDFAGPQPGTENANPDDQEQSTDDDEDHDIDDEPPALMSLEEAEEEEGQFTGFLDQMSRRRQNRTSNGRNAPTPGGSNNSDQSAPQAQFAPRPGVSVYPDIHVAGTGRSFGEAFTQALSRLQTQMAQPRQDGQNPQPAEATAAANEGAPPSPPQQTRAEPQGQGQHPWQFVAMPFMDFAMPMRAPQAEGPKRTWTPPPPPGPTLRQRIERREWEAGLRCHDVSCGLGPSDEDPLGDDINESLRKDQQLSVMSRKADEEGAKPVCCHKFHKSCLVSAERVALRGAEAIIDEAGGVEVSCPVCRGSGCVTKEQWDEGVLALQ